MAVRVAVPKLGNRMRGGLVAEWYQPDGASVQHGEPVCRLECDFVAFDIEAEGDGVLRHRMDAGLVRPPGDLLGVILGNGERMPAFEPVDLEALLPEAGADEAEAQAHEEPVMELVSLGNASWDEREDAETSGESAPGASAHGEWFDRTDLQVPRDSVAIDERDDASAAEQDEAGTGVLDDEFEAEAIIEATVADDSSEEVVSLPPSMASPRRFSLGEYESRPGDGWDIVPGDSADFASDLFAVPRDVTVESHVEPSAPSEEEPESKEFAAWLDSEPVAPAAGTPEATVPDQDWQAWSEEAIGRARDGRRAPAALTMQVSVALSEAKKMRDSLTREWRATAVRPSTEDVVLRAAARACRELPFVQTGCVALRVLGDETETLRLISGAASRPFRDAVEWRAEDERESAADFILTSFAAIGIEQATPGLGDGDILALGLGCERTEGRWDGDRFVPEVRTTLSLAYDPEQISEGVAARFMGRVRDLVDSPYALLAD